VKENSLISGISISAFRVIRAAPCEALAKQCVSWLTIPSFAVVLLNV
jgi:hypothetical protein